jgi:hypothetical protein
MSSFKFLEVVPLVHVGDIIKHFVTIGDKFAALFSESNFVAQQLPFVVGCSVEVLEPLPLISLCAPSPFGIEKTNDAEALTVHVNNTTILRKEICMLLFLSGKAISTILIPFLRTNYPKAFPHSLNMRLLTACCEKLAMRNGITQ